MISTRAVFAKVYNIFTKMKMFRNYDKREKKVVEGMRKRNSNKLMANSPAVPKKAPEIKERRSNNVLCFSCRKFGKHNTHTTYTLLPYAIPLK